MAPMPAQPSRKVAPCTVGPRMLNIVSRSLSLVGRMPGGGVPLRRLLLNCPAIIRISVIKPKRTTYSAYSAVKCWDVQCPMSYVFVKPPNDPLTHLVIH